MKARQKKADAEAKTHQDKADAEAKTGQEQLNEDIKYHMEAFLEELRSCGKGLQPAKYRQWLSRKVEARPRSS
jgi:F0F1-type ATP synthase membrane subunit b/b'